MSNNNSRSLAGGDFAHRARELKARRIARKEMGWNNNVKPISMYNS